jgi:hypothetical protein
MAKKACASKKPAVKDDMKKLVATRAKEFSEWKVKNATQKWFFSLDEREQKLLETSYVVVLQLCPELTWEEYLDRIRKADACNSTTKTIIEHVPLKF